MNRSFLVAILLELFLVTGPILNAEAADKTVVSQIVIGRRFGEEFLGLQWKADDQARADDPSHSQNEN